MLKTTLTALTLVVAPPLAFSTQSSEGYRLPPQEVVDIIDAVPNPSMRFSPDKQWTLAVQGSAMPSIEDISRRMLRIAGMRIDPAANSRYQTNFSSEILLGRRGLLKTQHTVPLPENARIASVTWSHDSNHFAYIIAGEKGSALYGTSVRQITNGVGPQLLTDKLNTVTGGLSWMPDGKTILARLLPEERGAEPTQNRVPKGPTIQEAGGDTSPLRTYQDLLSSAHDEALFDYYCTTQLVLIDLEGGQIRKVGKPGIYTSGRPSPNGQQLLVSRVTVRTPT